MEFCKSKFVKSLATVILGQCLCGALLAGAPSDASGSSSTSGDIVPVANASQSLPGNASSSAAETPLSRWLDINTFNLSLRYRSVFDVDGVHSYDQAQQRSLLDGRFKFDREGKYSIGFHFSSGHYFDWAYADFIGGGTDKAVLSAIPRLASVADRLDAESSGPGAVKYPSGGWAFLPRQLYFSAKPITGLNFNMARLGLTEALIARSPVTTKMGILPADDC